MVKFTFGRPAKMHGVTLGNTMGVNTWAGFAGSDDNAIVDGDFAVTEDELQPVLKSLLKEKINIVAIHQHMTHEEPRIMFFHYWGRGRQRPGPSNQRRISNRWTTRGQLTIAKLSASLSSKTTYFAIVLWCTGIITGSCTERGAAQIKTNDPFTWCRRTHRPFRVRSRWRKIVCLCAR